MDTLQTIQQHRSIRKYKSTSVPEPTLKAILEAAIIGRAHEKWGEVPVAVVVLAEGVDDLTLEELEPYLNENLARFKHPKDLVIVDALPRNAGGKVVKPNLRTAYGSKDAGLSD